MERSLGAYLISTDRARLDLDAIYTYLSFESYWARGRARDQIVRGVDNSLPFGGFKQSGIGVDRSLHALEKYTRLKTTWIDLSQG